jgi:hypothetical protein
LTGLKCDFSLVHRFDDFLGLLSKAEHANDLMIVDPSAPDFRTAEFRRLVVGEPRFRTSRIVIVRGDPEDDLFPLEDALDVDGMIALTYLPFQISFVLNRLLYPQAQNRRLHTRALARLDVEYRYPGDELFRKAGTTDASLGGLFLCADPPKAAGGEVEIRFRIPGSLRITWVTGQVAHVRRSADASSSIFAPAGIGVRLDDFSRADRSRLSDFLQPRLLRSDRRATERALSL